MPILVTLCTHLYLYFPAVSHVTNAAYASHCSMFSVSVGLLYMSNLSSLVNCRKKNNSPACPLSIMIYSLLVSCQDPCSPESFKPCVLHLRDAVVWLKLHVHLEIEMGPPTRFSLTWVLYLSPLPITTINISNLLCFKLWKWLDWTSWTTLIRTHFYFALFFSSD